MSEPTPAAPRILRRALLALAALVLLAVAAGDAYSTWRVRYPPWWRLDEARDADGLVAPDAWAKRWWGVMHPKELDFPTESVEAKGALGKTLRGWYWPVPSAGSTGGRPGVEGGSGEAAPAVLLVHGGGADRRSMLKYVRFLHGAGYAVAAFDLGEHGASDRDGSGLTFGWREADDVSGMIDFLEKAKRHEWIATLGDSVGGASVLLEGAKDPRARAVIAQNAYSDFEEFTEDVLASHGAPRLFGALVARTVEATWPAPRANVVPKEAIARISPRPVLVLQGSADSLCLPKHADALYAAAREPKELWVVPEARHATLWNTDPAGFEARVLAFLAKARASQ